MQYGHMGETVTIKKEKVGIRDLHDVSVLTGVQAGVDWYNAIDSIPMREGKTKTKQGSVVYHVLQSSLVASQCLAVPVEEHGEAKI